MVAVLEPRVMLASPALPLAEHPGAVPVRDDSSAFEDLLTGPPVTSSPSRPSDIAAVIFTSGSTGRPKGVLHTHRGLAHKALSMTVVHGLSGRDAVLMPAPLAHISGLLNAVLVPGAAAMRTVLMERWQVDEGLALIEAEQISFMIGPPSLFTAILEAPGFDTAKVASLRVVSSGMMGVRPEFIEEARVGLGAIVKRSYGSSEAPTVSTCTNDDPPERCRDTDGRAVDGAEIRIVDPVTFRRRRPGREGEVWVRGPELFAGYADAEETRGAIHRGWFRTGDLGVVDEQGWLRITGRLKELIIRGGENISAAEVERALEAHPGITQAVAVGCPDARLGERVAAFVVADRPIDVSECVRWFEEYGMARFKTPELVVQLEDLPALPAGKPDRAALKARAATLSVPA
jgi:acyl-CoA synthetase (AMP-forming)/AMP-acid ligase II